MPVSFSGGQAVPAAGTGAYSAAQQGSGAGSYNPSTSTLTYNGGNSVYGNTTASTPPPVPTTLDSSSLSTNTNPLSLPGQTANTNPNSFVSSLAPVNPNAPQTDTDTDSTSNQPGTPTDWKNNFMSSYLGLTQEAGQEGQAFQGLQEQYQVPEITQNLANIRGTIAQRTAAYMDQWQQTNTEHAALPYIAGEQTQIQRTQAIEIGVLTAQEQALSGNLSAATDIVNQTIQHEFQPIQTQLAAMQQFYQMNQNDLSASESAQLQQNYSIQSANYSNFLQTKSSAYQTAITYGASPQTLTALANAQDINGVWNALTGVVSGTANTGGSIVNGYDLSTYATDPDYASKIATASSTIGPITSVAQANQIISSIAPNSPITGAMIAQAAQQYGVDPQTLIAGMAVESQLGTQGAGAKTFNPANIGNTDDGSTNNLGNWQAGVNAYASWLSNHKVTAQQAATGQTASHTQSGVDFQTLEQSAPPMISAHGVLNQISSTGSAYIDLSKVPTASDAMVRVWAKNNNVALLSSDEVAQVKSVDEAINNITNTIAPAWDQIAYDSSAGTLFKGKFGAIGSDIGGLVGNAPTDTYSLNQTYLENKENLAQQISALSKSSPKLGLLATAANALPDNSGYFAGGSGIFTSWNPLTAFGAINPGTGDSYKTGVDKLNRTLQLLNQSIASYIPGDKGVALLPTTRGGTATPAPSASNTVNAPDGRTIQITD